jgi:1A family penicillin-binding protein
MPSELAPSAVPGDPARPGPLKPPFGTGFRRWTRFPAVVRARPRLAAAALANRGARSLRRAAILVVPGGRTALAHGARGLRRLGPALAGAAARAPALHLRHAVVGAAALVLVVGGYLAWCLFTLPFNGGLVVEPTPSALVLEASSGEVFATRGIFKGDKLAVGDLPPHLAKTVVAIEDRRFHDHSGVDLRGLIRAAWRNTRAGATREGGSTITQQLARLMFLSQERTLKRKVQEAMLAVWLEHQLPKDEILVRYLNTAYFGAGAYGVDAAAKRYFGKAAKDLSLAEAAMLAGLVRAPSQLAPHRNLDGARERAEVVLQAMAEGGFITRAEADAARASPATLRLPPETPPGANYFVDVVAADVRRLVGAGPADLALRTTLDRDLQKLAEEVIGKRLDAEGGARNVGQAALVALAPDGAILALVGGRDYGESQFNRATQAKRQPGSLFKLFVYQAAFEKGFSPQSVLVDRPVQIGDWEPQNANGRFRGAVNLRTAFANSINTIAAQLADEVGVDSVIAAAKRMGVQSELPAVPSLALGSAEVTLMEMTRAFAGIAAGAPVEPYAVQAVRAREQALYTRPAVPAQSRDAGFTRAAMLDLLTAVVREGTGKAARLPIPVAGKTGTTQDYRDAWFVGFTPEIVVGAWVGNDDNSPTKGVTGGDMPARIWRDFVSQATTAMARRKAPATASRVTAPAATGSVAANGRVRGQAEVVDTGTLEIRGQAIRLAGVEAEEGRAARALARYLRGRELDCAPAEGTGHRCRIDGEDLAELVIGNGGARATAGAAPELQAAEEGARAARLGIWGRRR